MRIAHEPAQMSAHRALPVARALGTRAPFALPLHRAEVPLPWSRSKRRRAAE
jgi:hypothetical protein